MGTEGTARRIGPIADEVLAWIASERAATSEAQAADLVTEDAIRKIELCALAAREAAMFHDLYGLEGNGATAPQVQE